MGSRNISWCKFEDGTSDRKALTKMIWDADLLDSFPVKKIDPRNIYSLYPNPYSKP